MTNFEQIQMTEEGLNSCQAKWFWIARGRLKVDYLISIRAWLDVNAVYILHEQLSSTCGTSFLCLDCTVNTRLTKNMPTNSGGLHLHCVHANCTHELQYFLLLLGPLNWYRFPPFLVLQDTINQQHIRYCITSRVAKGIICVEYHVWRPSHSTLTKAIT